MTVEHSSAVVNGYIVVGTAYHQWPFLNDATNGCYVGELLLLPASTEVLVWEQAVAAT